MLFRKYENNVSKIGMGYWLACVLLNSQIINISLPVSKLPVLDSSYYDHLKNCC